MTLKGFVTECHKKEVFKMLSIYIVSSWVLLQVLALVAEPLGFPVNVVTYLIIILLVGFPVYIYYVWKFKLLKYEIQQTEDPTTPYNKSAFQKMYFSSLFVISLLCGISVTLIVKNKFSQGISESTVTSEEDSNNKIAVLDFENTSGDKDLDNIGEIAAYWITHGITLNEVGQAISTRLLKDYSNIVKSTDGSQNLNMILQDYLKPSKVIDGAYYIEKDQLLLQALLQNGAMDKTLMTFETVKCDPNEPLDCVEQLKQQIIGYLSIENQKNNSGYIKSKEQGLSSYYEENPPKFKAFQYLLYALDKENDSEVHISYLNKALEEDPDFFEPKVHLLAHYYNQGKFAKTDSLIKTIEDNSKLNSRQKNWIMFYESIVNGKNDKAYKSILKEYKLASLDLSTNQTTMTIALQYVNKPEDIAEVYDEIPMDDLELENCYRCGFRYYLKALSDIELGNYQDVITSLNPITDIIEANYLKRPLIMAYVKSGQLNELDKYLSSFALTTSSGDMNYLYGFTGMKLLNANKDDKANNYFDKIITNQNNNSVNEFLAHAYYYKNDFINAESAFLELHQENPENLDFITHLAVSYHKNENIEEAKKTIQKLETNRSDYEFGAIDYCWAQYYAAIGNNNKALEFILKSVVQGNNFTPTTYHHDPHFRNLKNDPLFINHLNYWKNKVL